METSSPASCGQLKRILVADDSAIIRTAVKRLLLRDPRTADAEIVLAKNGRTALKKLLAGGFDLLLTDLTMPEMDGATLVAKMAESPALATVPVLILSSVELPEDFAHCGPYKYLHKRDLQEGLGAAITTVLAQAQAQAQASLLPVNPRGLELSTTFPSQHTHVLVVDASPTVRMMATKILKGMDVEVEQASHGQEAIVKMQRTRFHLVVTAIDMPEVTGLELAQIVREAEPEGQNTLIVGHTTLERSKCIAAGMDGSFPKSRSLTSLRTALEAWIAAARRPVAAGHAA